MPFTGDPANSATDRIRLIVGDTDICEEGLTDEIYTYLLDVNDDDEIVSALAALRYLIAKYASYVTEKAGKLFIKESEKFEQYRKLLDLLTKDPRTAIMSQGLPYAGGISWSDYCENLANPDARQVEYKEQVPTSFYYPTSFRGYDF